MPRDGEYVRVVEMWNDLGDNRVAIPPPIRFEAGWPVNESSPTFGWALYPWDLAPWHQVDFRALPLAMSPEWDMHNCEQAEEVKP